MAAALCFAVARRTCCSGPWTPFERTTAALVATWLSTAGRWRRSAPCSFSPHAAPTTYTFHLPVAGGQNDLPYCCLSMSGATVQAAITAWRAYGWGLRCLGSRRRCGGVAAAACTAYHGSLATRRRLARDGNARLKAANTFAAAFCRVPSCLPFCPLFSILSAAHLQHLGAAYRRAGSACGTLRARCIRSLAATVSAASRWRGARAGRTLLRRACRRTPLSQRCRWRAGVAAAPVGARGRAFALRQAAGGVNGDLPWEERAAACVVC